MLIQISQFILGLSLLVVLHELGHFIPAVAFRTRVEKFYLFFNPWFSLFKTNIRGTEVGIGWLPLGGYVKIAGMVDESMDTEGLAEEPKPYEYRSKKPWHNIGIVSQHASFNVGWNSTHRIVRGRLNRHRFFHWDNPEVGTEEIENIFTDGFKDLNDLIEDLKVSGKGRLKVTSYIQERGKILDSFEGVFYLRKI